MEKTGTRRKARVSQSDLHYASNAVLRSIQLYHEARTHAYDTLATYLVRDAIATYHAYRNLATNPMSFFDYMQEEDSFIRLASTHGGVERAFQQLEIDPEPATDTEVNHNLARLVTATEDMLQIIAHKEQLLASGEVLLALLTKGHDNIGNIGFTSIYDSVQYDLTRQGYATPVPASV